MVRLKVAGSEAKMSGLNMFQFLNGAIKRLPNNEINGLNCVFQFLNGAIKRFLSIDENILISEFQFLNGAIKSIIYGICDFLHDCFNSLMVRLKV